MNIDEIRARHESNDLWIEADTDGWQAHKDRGVLLKRIAELEAQVAELQENQQSWQEHDQGRIFSAKAMRLFIDELKGVIYRNCDSAQATDSDAKIIDEICQKEWRQSGGE